MLKVQRVNPFTGKVNEMEVNATEEEVRSYFETDLMIQEALPNATPEQREFVKTGITPEQWDSLFEEEEDEFV